MLTMFEKYSIAKKTFQFIDILNLLIYTNTSPYMFIILKSTTMSRVTFQLIETKKKHSPRKNPIKILQFQGRLVLAAPAPLHCVDSSRTLSLAEVC